MDEQRKYAILFAATIWQPGPRDRKQALPGAAVRHCGRHL